MEPLVKLEVYRKLFMDYAIERRSLRLMYRIEHADIYQLRGLAIEELKWLSQYTQYISKDVIFCPSCPTDDAFMHVLGRVDETEAKPIFGHVPRCKYYFLELLAGKDE